MSQHHYHGDHDIAELQRQRVLSATCGTCGRALLPDGDCYGCEVDRLHGKLAAERDRLRECLELLLITIKTAASLGLIAKSDGLEIAVLKAKAALEGKK